MKKLMMLFVLAFILLFPFQMVKATSLYRTNHGNGMVQLELALEEGYVGAVDVTLKLKGNVTLKAIDWDSKIPSNYVREYTYDEKTGIIRVYIATGDNAKNLVQSNGRIAIGILNVTAKENNTSFAVEATKLILTNMEYETVTKNNITGAGDNQFIYVITPPKDPDSEQQNPEPSQPNNQPNDNLNQDGEEKPNEPDESDKEEEEKPSETPNDPIDSSNGEKNPSDDVEKPIQKKQKSNVLLIVIGSILVFALIGGIIVYQKKHR